MDRQLFAVALRTALMQLDDLHSLRSSPLLSLLRVQGEEATPVLLQRILLDAIEALQGDADVTSTLAYDVLYYRYVEQMGQSEVAFQIGVSVRQLRRYQNNALEHLADRLWQRYRPGSDHAQFAEIEPETSGEKREFDHFDKFNYRQRDHAQIGGARSDEATQPAQTSADDAAFDGEIAWMRKSFPHQASRLDIEVTKALEDLAALIRHFAVVMQLDASPRVITTSLPPTVLRQAMMTLLTAVIPPSSGQSFVLGVAMTDSASEVELLLAQTSSEPVTLDGESWASLHTVSQLLQPFDSYAEVESITPLTIRLTMPVVTGIPILVIDDNDDVRYLYRRYAAHSRFHIIDTGNSKELLPLMQQFQPAAIVMDVMMPETDGWELLAQLRHHPLTAKTPVLICTILPQKQLSQYLGATAFIQKPVSQQAFLSALDHLLPYPLQTPNL